MCLKKDSAEAGEGSEGPFAYADTKKSIEESDETNSRSCAMIEGKSEPAESAAPLHSVKHYDISSQK